MSAKRLDNFPAIATAYRQFEFRSRLEAKWAVFFDLCGWSWSYEPIDCNGWIPDFAIGERPVLVEIKPAFAEEDFDEAKAKIIASGSTRDVIFLGADPVWSANTLEPFDSGPIIGWVFRYWGDHQGSPVWQTDDLHFGITEGNDKPGLCTMGNAWINQIWKAPDISHPNKWSRVSLVSDRFEKHLVERWAKACNVSKWVPYGQRQQNSESANRTSAVGAVESRGAYGRR